MRISELPILSNPAGANEQVIINSGGTTYAVDARKLVEKYAPGTDVDISEKAQFWDEKVRLYVEDEDLVFTRS